MNDQLAFSLTGSGRLRFVVGDLAESSVNVYDITTPSKVAVFSNVKVKKSGTKYQATVEAAVPGKKTFLAVGQSAVLSPASLEVLGIHQPEEQNERCGLHPHHSQKIPVLHRTPHQLPQGTGAQGEGRGRRRHLQRIQLWSHGSPGHQGLSELCLRRLEGARAHLRAAGGGRHLRLQGLSGHRQSVRGARTSRHDLHHRA